MRYTSILVNGIIKQKGLVHIKSNTLNNCDEFKRNKILPMQAESSWVQGCFMESKGSLPCRDVSRFRDPNSHYGLRVKKDAWGNLVTCPALENEHIIYNAKHHFLEFRMFHFHVELPNGSKRHLFTISSCQMQSSAATDGLTLAQLALRFRSSLSSWTWPSALQIGKVMGKKPGEKSGDGLETSEACDFKTKFISSVYFQECIILRVNHVTKKWTVKESFRSRPKKHHKWSILFYVLLSPDHMKCCGWFPE